MLANPFRVRYTEQLRDSAAFLRTFGAEILDILPPPDQLWSKLLVLRSAPGAGKTSILRLITPDSLRATIDGAPANESLRQLKDDLTVLGALSQSGEIARLGIHVGVGRDYKSLVDLGPRGQASNKIFFKLLDARIMAKSLEAVLAAANLTYPTDIDRVSLIPHPGSEGEAAREAARQIASVSGEIRDLPIAGDDLLVSARNAERSVLRLLDSLIPVDWANIQGHARLYSLQILSNSSFAIDGIQVEHAPVLLFDDVHELTAEQRERLYEELVDRNVRVARWVAERKEAVEDSELLTGQTAGREYEIVLIEDALANGQRGGRTARVERFLSNIANTRSFAPLSSVSIAKSFTELLADDLDDRAVTAAKELALERVERIVGEYPRFESWFGAIKERDEEPAPIVEAARWREYEILIRRQLARSSQTLFDLEDDSVDFTDKLGSFSTASAARLFLSKDTGLPYYFGPTMVAELSSRNVEQYLGLAGDLFDLMSTSVALRRGASLTASEQDARVRRTSRDLWDAIVRRVQYGEEVRRLLEIIANRAKEETYRSTAPYAPGVTGLAVPFNDLAVLNEATSAGGAAARLGRALSSSVANNLIEISTEPVKTKGRFWAVLNLNRLLCPEYELPLQRGGWRETSIRQLAGSLDAAMVSGGLSRSADALIEEQR
ncbi:ORC-CDC6 family AAA ATPase [Microbacterium lacticum]